MCTIKYQEEGLNPPVRNVLGLASSLAVVVIHTLTQTLLAGVLTVWCGCVCHCRMHQRDRLSLCTPSI